jgi:hypothetical protein
MSQLLSSVPETPACAPAGRPLARKVTLSMRRRSINNPYCLNKLLHINTKAAKQKAMHAVPQHTPSASAAGATAAMSIDLDAASCGTPRLSVLSTGTPLRPRLQAQFLNAAAGPLTPTSLACGGSSPMCTCRMASLKVVMCSAFASCPVGWLS